MIKQLARAIGEQAVTLDIASLDEVANRVTQASGPAVPACARELIGRLRAEAGVGQRGKAIILLIGGDRRLCDDVSKHVRASDCAVMQAQTAAEAARLINQHDVMCMVLHAVLPDADGQTLFENYCEQPRTASIPILIIANKPDETLKEDSPLHSSDGYIEGAMNSEPIVEWITQRIRRAPEANKAARRDQLTRLMNRAAFREVFKGIQTECAEAEETLVIAVISADSSRAILSELATADCEQLLQDFRLRLSNFFRATDVVARWSTYEFIALFPGKNQLGGARAVEKVIEMVKHEPFISPDDKEIRLSISAGMTLVTGEDALDDAFASANQFVYEATARGGDQVVSDATKERATQSQRVVLIVPDAVTTKVLIQLFDNDGFQVTHCSEWNEQSVELMKQQRHHLAVIDVHFPPSDGFDVLEKIRSEPKHSRMPIAMLVDQNAEEQVTRALELGANDYIARPLSPFTFISRMRRLLSRGVSRAGGGPCILVADDEVGPLVLAATSLQRSGAFDVILARGHDDALERIENDAPTALLLDSNLSVPDDGPLLKVLTQRNLLRNVPVILAIDPKVYAKARTPKYVAGTIENPGGFRLVSPSSFMKIETETSLIELEHRAACGDQIESGEFLQPGGTWTTCGYHNR